MDFNSINYNTGGQFDIPEQLSLESKQQNQLPNPQVFDPEFDPFQKPLKRTASIISDHSFTGHSQQMNLSQNAGGSRRQSITAKLYALCIASQPGIYQSWVMAKTLIEGCPGAIYKGFVTVEECMQFIWERFPNATFTLNEQGDYIMDNPEPVFQIIEEARQKKEKNSGILLADDMSAYEPLETNASTIEAFFQADPNLQISLNAEQKLALELVQAGKNVFISGARKTGKDAVMSHIYNHLVSEKKSFHITSASAITSQNSSAAFTLGWTGMSKAIGTKKQMLTKVRKNPQARKSWIDVSCLIIQYCSMLPASLLDIIDFLAREIRKNPTTPFGGIQIILLGFTHGHLPRPSQSIFCPSCGQGHRGGTGFGSLGSKIGQCITCSNEKCKSLFINSWVLFPFEATVWDESQFHYIHLTETFEKDARLGEMLTGFAKEPPFSAKTLESSNELMYKPRNTDQQMTVICANNEEMNTINDDTILSIPGDIVKYESIDTVLNNFDFSSHAQQKDGPTEEILNLKVNAHVLVISDNGKDVDTGVVVDFAAPSPDQIETFSIQSSHGIPQIKAGIKKWLKKNPLLPRVKMEGQEEPRIVNCRVWIIRTKGRATAWRIQLPVRLAYAISIAKGQGLMLPKIMISAGREWLAGEMYMALNLAKSFDSIYLEGMTGVSFTADSRVLEFMKTAVHGRISTSVKTNHIPKGFSVAPPSIASLKRHSLATFGGGMSKKRRPSIPFIPSFMDQSLGSNMQIVDPQLLRFQQQIPQRRHSYQPLSSYQELQFAFLQPSNSFMPQMMQGGGMDMINLSLLSNSVPIGMPAPDFQMAGGGGGAERLYHRASISSYEGDSSLSYHHQNHPVDPFGNNLFD